MDWINIFNKLQIIHFILHKRKEMPALEIFNLNNFMAAIYTFLKFSFFFLY